MDKPTEHSNYWKYLLLLYDYKDALGRQERDTELQRQEKHQERSREERLAPPACLYSLANWCVSF